MHNLWLTIYFNGSCTIHLMCKVTWFKQLTDVFLTLTMLNVCRTKQHTVCYWYNKHAGYKGMHFLPQSRTLYKVYRGMQMDIFTWDSWFHTWTFPLYKLANIHGSVGCKSTLLTRSDRADNFRLISSRRGCK